MENPKSAYMLVYHRHASETVREAGPEAVSEREEALLGPLLEDNQRHTLLSRMFTHTHLRSSLDLVGGALRQSWVELQALALTLSGEIEGEGEGAALCVYRRKERVLVRQLSQAARLVLQLLARATPAIVQELYSQVASSA